MNDSPTHAHHRYVINFGDVARMRARRWPDLMAIVEAKVKPERQAEQPRRSASGTGGSSARHARALSLQSRGWNGCWSISRSSAPGVCLSSRADGLRAHARSSSLSITYAAFCVLQSRPHEVWARFFGISMKDDLAYTPSDCFETFPFPEGWEAEPDAWTLSGKAYYEFRAALMVRNNEGLTEDLQPLPRPRGAAIPTSSSSASCTPPWTARCSTPTAGLTSRPTASSSSTTRIGRREESSRRKKPWRYRWPDDVRDEVLARLLELNGDRAAQVAQAGGRQVSRRKPDDRVVDR